MKRLIALICLITLGASCVVANPVDEQRAQRVAENFLRQVSPRVFSLKKISLPKEYTTLYVFADREAFVMVAADDVAHPILGYSPDNGFPQDRLPENLELWLDDYEAAILWAREGTGFRSDAEGEWAELENVSKPKGRKAVVVAPLLKTQWDQSPYYNELCPYDTAKEDRTVTGCAATAMAQIMRYWEYPTHGIGSESYTHSTYGEQSADFANTTYDWGNMPLLLKATSTRKQVDAVATLMYHCGVALHMDYGVAADGGSAASIVYAQNAFDAHFGYQSSMTYKFRGNSSNDDVWIAALRNELDAGRPIYYAGCGTRSSCHAWVCDGYDDSRFHMNWGWGGYGDGYYAIGALNPGSGGIGSGGNTEFNASNQGIFNIRPPEGLRVSREVVPINVSGDSVIVSVFSSNNWRNWTASTESDWLTIDSATAEGLGDSRRGELVLRADTNWTGEERTATVVIKHWEYEVSFEVVQSCCKVVETLPYSENFEGDNTACWRKETLAGSEDPNFKVLTQEQYAKDGEHSFQFAYSTSQPERMQYLISPELNLPSAALMTFSYMREWSYKEHFSVLYSVTDNRAESFIYLVGDGGMSAVGWNEFEGIVPQEAKYVAIRYDNVGFEGRNWVVDDIILTAADGSDCTAIQDTNYAQDFETDMDCWIGYSRNVENMEMSGNQYSSQAHSGLNNYRFAANKAASNLNQYLISPRIEAESDIEISFFYRKAGSAADRFCLLYSTTGNTPESFVALGDTVEVETNEWKEYTATVPQSARYIAINYCPETGRYVYIDDINIRSSAPAPEVSIDHVAESAVKVLTMGRDIVIESVPMPATVYDMCGRIVGRAEGHGSQRVRVPAAGVYVVRVGQQARKIVVL